jgi:cytochrome c oxidase subunit 2
MFSGTYFAANQTDVVVQSPSDYQQWLADAAAQTPSPAFNQAAFEYSQATEQESGAKGKVALRGWDSIPPAPPPVVNYAPKHEPDITVLNHS